MKVYPHSGLLIGPTNLISCFPTTEMAEGFFSLVTTLKCEFHVKRIICELQVEELNLFTECSLDFVMWNSALFNFIF